MNAASLAPSFFRQRKFRHAWDVLAVLVERDLKVLYKRSALGVGWALAGPLLQVLIFVFIFRHVLGDPVPHYAAFVFTGVLVWGWFHASLLQATSVITSNRALVRQPGFPLLLLPVVSIAVRLFHFSLALPLLLTLLWWQDLRPVAAWCSLPLLVLVQFALTAGLACPLAALNVRLRDTQHIAAVLLQLAMYLTPVFYSVDAVPAAMRRVLFLNPMVPLLEAWRDVLLRGQWPDALSLAWLVALAGALLIVGRRLFLQQSRSFVEEL